MLSILVIPIGSNSDLESVYRLCIQHPAALMSGMKAQNNESATVDGVDETRISGKKRKK